MADHSSIDYFVWPNRYMLTFLGFWPMDPNATAIYKGFTYFRIVFSIFVMCSILVPEIFTIIIYWGNISILADVGCVMVEVVQFLFKFFYMVVRQTLFCRIYKFAQEFWFIINEKTERENFERFAKRAKQITIIFFVSSISNVFTFMAASIVVSVNNHIKSNGSFYTRNLPFDICYGFDTQRTPNFEIVVCSQFLVLVIGATGIVGFDATMMTLILHICGQFRLIHARFQAIGNKIREGAYQKLQRLDSSLNPKREIGQCIEHHQRTLRFVEELNNLLSPVIFVQLMTSGINICLSGYALIMSDDNTSRAEITKCGIYILTIFVQLIVWCWPGELLTKESTAVGQVVYFDLPWNMLTVDQQRDLSFVIYRSQKECNITAFRFQVINIRKLTDVFNTAASYLALLRSINENQTKQL